MSLPKSLTLSAILLGAAIPQAAVAMELPRALATMTKDWFAERVVVIDDPAKPHIVLSTERATSQEGPAKGASIKDAHARVVIDRATGQRTWFVEKDLLTLRLHGPTVEVRYHVGDALVRAKPHEVITYEDRCPATDNPGRCIPAQKVVFAIDQNDMRRIAAANGGQNVAWQVTFADEHAREVLLGFSSAELGGLLQASDKFGDEYAG